MFIISGVVTHSIPFRLGWAVDAAQRLRQQHGSISHPQKIPSKYWVLKVRGRSSKKRNYPCSRTLVADQAITHPLKRRCTARFNIESMGSMDPTGNCPIRAIHLSWQAGHVVTGSTHPRCKPLPTGAQESPRMASERPRPKESQSQSPEIDH